MAMILLSNYQHRPGIWRVIDPLPVIKPAGNIIRSLHKPSDSHNRLAMTTTLYILRLVVLI